MRRIGLVVVLIFSVALTPLAGAAQQAGKIPRVGLLRPGSPPDVYVDAFRRGLNDRGHVEQQTIVLEYRWAEGSFPTQDQCLAIAGREADRCRGQRSHSG